MTAQTEFAPPLETPALETPALEAAAHEPTAEPAQHTASVPENNASVDAGAADAPERQVTKDEVTRLVQSERPTEVSTTPSGDAEPAAQAATRATADTQTALPAEEPTFLNFGLAQPVQEAVTDGGYVNPTPIQAESIPVLLEGRDMLGQAATGTGKTAAFALPLLSRIDPADRTTQVLVLTPTRELAMQVAKAFRAYGRNLRDLTVQPIYGGASYFHQIKALERGVQIVVGTPGRVMDHMRRGTLKLDTLRCLVLDEGDEMLRMGFVDDVTWILEQTPSERQTALFSATMPPPIRRIAEQHLTDPARITIRDATATATTVQARYVVCQARDKAAVLHRVLETEDTDGVLVFVRTKEATNRLAETLAEHGFSAEALNGDMPQAQRERTVQQLKNGRLDIVVATDVAARGLDVQRISHVINFDVPHDTESYVHRIGRTGRAGRSGEAILFVTRKDIRRVRQIERETRQRMDEMSIPTAVMVNGKRQSDFLNRLMSTLESRDLEAYRSLVTELQEQSSRDFEDIAVAVIAMLQGDRPFLMDERHDFATQQRPMNRRSDSRQDQRQDTRGQRFEKRPAQHHDRQERPAAGRNAAFEQPQTSQPSGSHQSSIPGRPPQDRRPPHRREAGMECFRIEVGHEHGVEPGNIVGAIANEAGLTAKDIGRISIQDDHSFVDLPEGMPRQIFRQLKDVIVSGRHLRITRTEPYKPAFQKRGPASGGGGGKPRRSGPKNVQGRKPARNRKA